VAGEGAKTRVELVLDKLKIEYVRRGTRLLARCPFHEDHDPSWFIRLSGEREGQHHCYACKSGGTLAELVKHKLGYGTLDGAGAWLDRFFKQAPAEAPVAKRVHMAPRPAMAKLFRMPREVEYGDLESWPTPARRYVEERGISAEQVKRWHIGFAVEGRLAGRIVIPVWTRLGVDGLMAHSYHARTFSKQERRYLYPDEREQPNLDAMFGELWWPPPEERDDATVYVPEGAIDALSVERVVPVGNYVSALGGSNVRTAYVQKLARFGEVVILTDANVAGDIAANLLMLGLVRHTRVRRVRLPEGEDATSLGTTKLTAWLGLPN
jgi:hypothetical protein